MRKFTILAVLMFIIPVVYSSTGPIVYYDFTDHGNDILIDVQNNVNGSITQLASSFYAPGYLGTAGNFSDQGALGNFVEIDDPELSAYMSLASDPWTFSAYVYSINFSNGINETIFYMHGDSAQEIYIDGHGRLLYKVLNVSGNPSPIPFIGTTALNNSAWNHILLERQVNTTGTTLNYSIWVNGVEDVVYQSTVTPGPKNAKSFIGRWEDGTLRFNGTIDEFRFYNRTLSLYEKRQLGNQTVLIDDCTSYEYPILNITYYDEISNEKITSTNDYNINWEISVWSGTLSGTLSGKTSNAFCSFTALEDSVNIYGTFNVESPGYTSRIFENDATNPYNGSTEPATNLSLYLLSTSNTSTVTFTAKDSFTLGTIEGVSTVMQKFISGEYQTVETKITDVTGNVQFSYEADEQYRFIFSSNEYNTREFDLNPITATSYDVLMTRTAIINESQDYDRVKISYGPRLFYEGNNNFSINFSSTFGELLNYGYTLTYPGGTFTESGTTATGEAFNVSFSITNPTAEDRLQLDFYYSTSIAGTREFTYYYPIATDEYNITMIGLRDNTYGLGVGERLLIAVLGALFVVGIAFLIGRPVPGLVLGLFWFGYLVYIGFIPWWSVAITMLVGVLFVGLRGEV